MSVDAVHCYPSAAGLSSHRVAAHGLRSAYLAWVWTDYDPATGCERGSTCRACRKAFPSRAAARDHLVHRASRCKRAADEGLVEGLAPPLLAAQHAAQATAAAASRAAARARRAGRPRCL